MKFAYVLLLVLMLFGACTTPQDHTPPPINHNLMTLEMQSCDRQEVGLLGCFFNEQKEGQLTVPLWYKGEYQIKSERCHYLKNSRYEGSQKLNVPYQELLANKPDFDDSCLFNIKVFIDKFDNGFEGFFVLSQGDIKVMNFEALNKQYLGYAGLQIIEGSRFLNPIKITAQTPGILFWEGCPKSGKKKYSKDPTVSIEDVLDGVVLPSTSCILTMGLIPDDETLPVEIGKVHINIYEKTVVPLPLPVLDYDEDFEILTVRADKLAAGLGINDSVSVKSGKGKKKISREVLKDEPADVRIMTSNGRFLLLKVKNGEILWVK